jgi:predicted kinase
VGLPGSGKSTYIRRAGGGGVSSDAIRVMLADDATDQSIHETVFRTVRYLLRQRLALGRPVTFIDATNLVPQERSPYIGIGKSYGCQMEAVFLDVPLTTCMERNAGRDRVVPEEAMRKMAEKLEPPTLAEGFGRIDIVRG